MTTAPLMTVAEVAERLACSTRQVYSDAATGALVGVRVGKRGWRFEPHEIDAYIARNRTGPPSRRTA